MAKIGFFMGETAGRAATEQRESTTCEAVELMDAPMPIPIFSMLKRCVESAKSMAVARMALTVHNFPRYRDEKWFMRASSVEGNTFVPADQKILNLYVEAYEHPGNLTKRFLAKVRAVQLFFERRFGAIRVR